MNLSQVLELMACDDPNSYSQDTFDAVDAFIGHFGEHNFASRLLDEAPPDVDPIRDNLNALCRAGYELACSEQYPWLASGSFEQGGGAEQPGT